MIENKSLERRRNQEQKLVKTLVPIILALSANFLPINQVQAANVSTDFQTGGQNSPEVLIAEGTMTVEDYLATVKKQKKFLIDFKNQLINLEGELSKEEDLEKINDLTQQINHLRDVVKRLTDATDPQTVNKELTILGHIEKGMW